MITVSSKTETPEFSKRGAMAIEPFRLTLFKHGLQLVRDKTTTLQINAGYLCDRTCRHCHFSAGPGRKENMDMDTAEYVIEYARRAHFEIIDITGGAPGLDPNLVHLIEGLRPLASKIMIRSNLSVLNNGQNDQLISLFKKHQVIIVASFPSLNEAQTESQRGRGIFSKSISVLKKLNRLGYGHEGSGLELNLVSNPTGAFLPSSQIEAEKRFHQILDQKWGVTFNHLYNFGNVPLGRFRQWLVKSNNLERYIEKLISSFNPCAVEGLMCRTLVSVSWNGYLYDCDFNIARGLFMGGQKTHVSKMTGPPSRGSSIAVADHCYTCASGSGFT